MPLLFGHYAWLKDWHAGTQKVEVQEAGSGIFVAPGVALTARHVSKGFEKLDARLEAAQKRTTVFAEQYAIKPVITEYAGLLYQVPNGRMAAAEEVRYWGVTADWPSPDTDISILNAEPTSTAAKKAAAEVTSFLEWQLLPPQAGAEVDVFGFPKAKISVESGFHVHDVELRSEPVRVVKSFEVLQSHGFTEFPGFEVNRVLDHGFSGGPVFYNDRLIGVFSGPNYVSVLWPLLLHDYVHPADNPRIDLLKPGVIPARDVARRTFGALFENATIRAIDLEEVQGRARRLPCAEALAGSSIESRCDKSHAVLMR
jgi:hypothetical protein